MNRKFIIIRPTIDVPDGREEGHERVRVVPGREAGLVGLRVLRLALGTILQFKKWI